MIKLIIKFLLVHFFITLVFLCNFSYAKDIKFIHITDVHLNSDRNSIKSRMIKNSKDLLEDAIQQINAMKNVDFVVFTGDSIDKPDKRLLALFAQTANKLNVPWYWTSGNHDIGPEGVNRKIFLEILNNYNKSIKPKNTYYSFRKGDNLFIFLDGAIDNYITSQGLFSQDNIKFLDKELKKNKRAHVFIFQHFPVIYPYNSKDHGVLNQEEYIKLIDSYPNVKAIFTGHFHITKIISRNNVLHINTPSLVQYPNAFRVITAKNTSEGKFLHIETIETGLKDIQNKSFEYSSSPEFMKGKETDRNLKIKIDMTKEEKKIYE